PPEGRRAPAGEPGAGRESHRRPPGHRPRRTKALRGGFARPSSYEPPFRVTPDIGVTTNYVVTCFFDSAELGSTGMARTYGLRDCPVARTLDLIGERWTILILRDLFLQGPRRFQDFQESLRGVAPNTLSARLKTLERNGLIARRIYSEHPPRL